LDADTVDSLHVEEIVERTRKSIVVKAGGSGARGITNHDQLTNVTANQHHTPTASGDIDHGSVTGLADDDHTQYVPVDGVARQLADAGYPNAVLKDGSRGFTGAVDFADGWHTFAFSAHNSGGIRPTVTRRGYLGHDSYRWYQAYIAFISKAEGMQFIPAGYIQTHVTNISHLYLKSYDTAQRVCLDFINGRVDVPRAGDITMLANKEIKNVGVIKAPNMPVADPADGTSTLWNNGGVVTVGT